MYENAPTSTTNREMTITRLIDASREQAFDAFTDREHIGEWWGPDGFSTTTLEMDVRVGGRWRNIMHGPDGTDYPNRVVYVEVTRPARLAYVHGEDVDNDPNEFNASVTFVEEGGKTRVTLYMQFKTASLREEAAKFGAVEGGHQTLSRLAAHLAVVTGD